MNDVKKEPSTGLREWVENDDDVYKTFSKEEMDALRIAKPRNFASLNSWWVVLSQVAITLAIAGICFIFLIKLTEAFILTRL